MNAEVAPDRYTVVVRGLVLTCSIGIRRVERDRPQRVRVSVELTATAETAFPAEDRRRVRPSPVVKNCCWPKSETC